MLLLARKPVLVIFFPPSLKKVLKKYLPSRTEDTSETSVNRWWDLEKKYNKNKSVKK